MLPVRQTIGGLGNLLFKQAYIVSKCLDGEIPDVYLQSEKYFKKHALEIKKSLLPGIGYTNMVSVHIRRGDYLDKNGFYVDLCETDYYKRAVNLFPDDRFLVFCRDRQDRFRDKEDRKFVKSLMTDLVGDRFEIWSGRNEVSDLNKMASCKSNIMANSSFSWWAAYLNMNPTKKVICPSQWFSDGMQRTELLDEWIKI